MCIPRVDPKGNDAVLIEPAGRGIRLAKCFVKPQAKVACCFHIIFSEPWRKPAEIRYSEIEQQHLVLCTKENIVWFEIAKHILLIYWKKLSQVTR